jgi:hypothetical protein
VATATNAALVLVLPMALLLIVPDGIVLQTAALPVLTIYRLR